MNQSILPDSRDPNNISSSSHFLRSMGRTRTKKKVHTKATDPPIQHATVPKSTPSLVSLIEKAQSLIVQCDYELALRFIRRVIEQEPKNAEAKEMLGVALLETGEIMAAKEVHFFGSNPIQTQSNPELIGI